MCLIFNLPEMLNSGKIQSGFSNVTNFFTQKQLSETAISGGLTLESIPQLTQYNNLIAQGVTRTQAFKQTMIGATDATKQMALRIANGTVQLNELTTASKAARLGMSLLNAAMNIAASFVTIMGVCINGSYSISVTCRVLSSTRKRTSSPAKPKPYMRDGSC